MPFANRNSNRVHGQRTAASTGRSTSTAVLPPGASGIVIGWVDITTGRRYPTAFGNHLAALAVDEIPVICTAVSTLETF